MTSFHRSLTLWFGGVALTGTLFVGVPAVRAQFGYEQVEPARSPQEAAKMFAQLLAQGSDTSQSTSALRYATISRKDTDELGYDAATSLVNALAKDAKYPQFEASVPQNAKGQTIVDVRPSAQPLALPVVCVREGDGWKVDLIQTFAKRRSLSEGRLQSAIFALTGSALPGLLGANRPDVQGQICQSNLKQLGLGLAQYAQDYDERLPRAAQWTDEVKPYARSDRFYSCPSVKGRVGGYAFNSNFSMVFLAQISQNDLDRVPIIYETRLRGFNVSGTGADLERRHSYDANPLASQTSSLFLSTSGQVFSEAANLSPRSSVNFFPKLGPVPPPVSGFQGFVAPPAPPPASR